MKITVRKTKKFNNHQEDDIVAIVFLGKMPIAEIIHYSGKRYFIAKFGIDEYRGSLICSTDDSVNNYEISLRKCIKYAKKVKNYFYKPNKQYINRIAKDF